MKQLLLVLCLVASPAAAEPPAAQPDDLDQGFSLMQEGAKLLLRGMMAEVEPQLNDLSEAWAKAQPQIAQLLTLMDDLGNYHMPELLENGDILIRRKTPAELQLEGLPGPETDL